MELFTNLRLVRINFNQQHTKMNTDNREQNPEKIPSKTEGKGISRRGFLRGAGLTTVGTVALQAGVLGSVPREVTLQEKALGPDAVAVKLNVNGHIQTISVEPRTTLAYALRDNLKLTGTKVVCDRGACSACTVWVDGKPVNSCLILAVEMAGKKITTIEGLGTDDKLHPVQQAFIDHDASQCGFCTPGMIMTATHFLQKNPKPSLADVKIALRGNLCRCGTHPNVFKATMAAAQKI